MARENSPRTGWNIVINGKEHIKIRRSKDGPVIEGNYNFVNYDFMHGLGVEFMEHGADVAIIAHYFSNHGWKLSKVRGGENTYLLFER